MRKIGGGRVERGMGRGRAVGGVVGGGTTGRNERGGGMK